MCFRPIGLALSATSSTLQNPLAPLILLLSLNSFSGSRETFGMNHVASSMRIMEASLADDSVAARAEGVMSSDEEEGAEEEDNMARSGR